MESEITPKQLTKDVWIVPCRLDKGLKKYVPILSPMKNSNESQIFSTRKSWIPEEDEMLTKIIENNGARQWSAIAIELNQAVHGCEPIRKGKQCRERWLGHLNPKIIKHSWSAEEDSILLHKQSTLGNRWSEISKYLYGRTENQIKNRWRKLSKDLKSNSKKNIKNVFAEVPIERMLLDVELSSLLLEYQSYNNIVIDNKD